MKKVVNKTIVVCLGLLISAVAFAGLESVTYISDLVVTNPLSNDPASQGDDHIRNLKVGIKTTFPNINAAITLTDENINDAFLKSASNTVTGQNTIFSHTAPVIRLEETDAAANNGKWRYYANAEQLSFGCAIDDALSTENCSFLINRTGTTIDSIALAATSLALNGAVNASASIMTLSLDSTGGSGPSLVQFKDAGVTRGYVGSENSANQCVSGSAATDVCLRSESGAIRFSVDSGSTALAVMSGTSMTVNGGTVWHSSNDGAASGLDADLLDGNSSAFFRDMGNANAGTLAVARGGTGTTTSTGTGNVVLSANPTLTGTLTASTVSATTLQQGGSGVWTAANDGSGSGLDADLIDGANAENGAAQKIARMYQTSTTPCVLSGDVGITSCGTLSAGRYSIDYTAAGFSSTPVCVASIDIANTSGSHAHIDAPTSTTIEVYRSAGGVFTNGPFTLICMGT